MLMQYPIMGSLGQPSATATNYASINAVADQTWSGAAGEVNRSQIVPVSMELRGITVSVAVAPGVGNSRTFTVMKNGIATGITATISGANTSASSTTIVEFAAGDTISLESSISGTPAAAGRTRWYSIARGRDVALMAINSTNLSNASTVYAAIVGGQTHAMSVLESDYEIIVPTSGKLDMMRVALDGSPGAGKSYTFTLRKNNADTAVTCVIADTSTQNSDLANSVTVAAGDRVVVSSTPSGTPTARLAKISMRFIPDNDGESFIGLAGSDPSSAAVRYNQPQGTGAGTWQATETNADMAMPAGVTLKKLYAKVVTAPGVGKSWVFRTRLNAANAGPSLTISDAATTGNDSTSSSATSGGDLLSVMSTPSGTPTAPGGMSLGLLVSMPMVNQGVMNFSGAEMASASAPYYGGAESMTSNTSVVAGGTSRSAYAFRANPSGAAVGSIRIGSHGLDGSSSSRGVYLTTGYVEFAFKPSSLPSAASGEQMVALLDTSSAVKLTVRLRSDGKLSVYDSAGSLVATGATVLAAGNEYSIGIKVGTGASAAYELRINNASELSGTANQGTNRLAFVELGKYANVNSASVDFVYDDIVISDDAFTGGTLRVMVATVNAAGSTNGWTQGTGSSDYTQLDELPPSAADYIAVKGAASGFSMNVKNASQLPSMLTLKSVKNIGFYRESSSITSSTSIRMKSGGTTFTSGYNYDIGTSEVALGRVFNVDPNTGAAWTTAALDGVEVGAYENVTTSAGLACTWIGAMVLYDPAPSKGGIMTLGVGS